MHFDSDRSCLEKISLTAGRQKRSEVTIGWIQNTMELGSIALSAGFRAEIEANHSLEIVGEAQPLHFDEDGNLNNLRGFFMLATSGSELTHPVA
jgi:hypothetical protein